MKTSGGCVGGVVVTLLVVVVIFVTYFCWPATQDNDDNDNDNGDDNKDNVNGNNNKIQTNEIRKTEVSMVHIEGLQGQLSTSKWVMFLGFSFIFISMIYAALHFKCVKLPRRMRKKLERERTMTRLDDIEAILVERGYMTKKAQTEGKEEEGEEGDNEQSDQEGKRGDGGGQRVGGVSLIWNACWMGEVTDDRRLQRRMIGATAQKLRKRGLVISLREDHKG